MPFEYLIWCLTLQFWLFDDIMEHKMDDFFWLSLVALLFKARNILEMNNFLVSLCHVCHCFPT